MPVIPAGAVNNVGVDGLGMGLHICSEIVRSHDGRLWADNNVGPGLTVHCCIPLTVPSDVPGNAPDERADVGELTGMNDGN